MGATLAHLLPWCAMEPNLSGHDPSHLTIDAVERERDLLRQRQTHLVQTVLALEAERDRLRDELEAVRPQYEAHVRMLTVTVEELTAERDRLRAVVDAAITGLREIGEHLDGHPVEQVIRRLRRALDGSEATDG